MKPDIHGVRTHWIRGFMAFQRAAALVQTWPEITLASLFPAYWCGTGWVDGT